MKKIIVTGGCGYIGSHTVIKLIEHGYEPIIIDNFSNTEKIIYDGICKITGVKPLLYEMDVRDFKSLRSIFIKNASIEGVIHFAAFKSVNESIDKSLDYYDNNLGSLVNVLRLTREFKIPQFIFSSSCIVYGSTKDLPVHESANIGMPANPYGKTKTIGEIIIQDVLVELPSTNCVSLRYFNPIGNHESGIIGELPKGTPSNLVPYVLQVASGKLRELQVYGDDYDTQDGTCLRDYIHVMDLAHAHVLALKKKSNTPSLQTYNVGTGKPTSVLEIIQEFEDIAEIKLNYSIGKRRPGDIEKIWADSSLISSELSWKAQYTTKDALRHAWLWESRRSS